MKNSSADALIHRTRAFTAAAQLLLRDCSRETNVVVCRPLLGDLRVVLSSVVARGSQPIDDSYADAVACYRLDPRLFTHPEGLSPPKFESLRRPQWSDCTTRSVLHWRCYAGNNELLAWVILFTFGHGSSSEVARRVNKLRPRLERLLAEGSDKLSPESGPQGLLVLSVTGQPLYYSSPLSEWLRTPETTSGLKRWLNRPSDEPETCINGLVLRRERLDYINRAWGVQVSRGRAIYRAPESRLSPMQRKVAECVLSGQSCPEIARNLGKHLETVRSHLRSAYERLGVTSRIELVQALRADYSADQGRKHLSISRPSI